jgi:hypothetical protein
MSMLLSFAPTPAGTEFRLLGADGPLTQDRWGLEAPADLLPGIDLLRRLVADNMALEDDEFVLVEHAAIADLSAREARFLALPPQADAQAVIRLQGLIARSDCRVVMEWQRLTGQAIVAPIRCGAFLRVGDAWRRLPRSLFDIAEAVDAYGATDAQETGARLSALRQICDVLPQAAADGLARGQGALSTIRLLEADAFSLDYAGSAADPELIPVLHRAGEPGDAPLLPAEQQTQFAQRDFYGFAEVRAVYTPARDTYLILAPTLRRVLSVIRAARAAPAAHRRALLANPRGALREALGDDVSETVLEGLFRETPQYAERVRGLGLWQPRVVPWVAVPGADWFGPETGGTAPPGPKPRPGGLIVGDRRLTFSPDEAIALAQKVERAIAQDQPTVAVEFQGETIAIPASVETLGALNSLQRERARTGDRDAGDQRDQPGPEVLLIAPNLDELEIEARCRPRPGPDRQAPLLTVLKPHQQEGLDWLMRAWREGQPGVLLADDMGLGKTLQALAFLAWLRLGMAAGTIARAPLLVVAPTGLLENWRAEHDRHLAAPGLGACLRAYGAGLAALRTSRDDGSPGLDTSRIAASDWVLTTYETLRDHDRDFGAVRFAAALFDEAQKIKSPAARMTDAAKAMNADFRIALTGTPVENRLADLWCIVDGLHPGCLGELRGFSARYEAQADIQRLRQLKAQLDQSRGGRPPLLLRRLKEDQLPDLPSLQQNVVEAPMPGRQLAAYRAVIDGARNARRRGAVLEALQALRRVCLHPGAEDGETDDDFIAASARTAACMRMLQDIAAKQEAALVFLDDLNLMARLAGIIQRRFGLPATPMVINGKVAGHVRQARVDRFQAAPDGFDVMLLSPRAAGVGLTLTRANHVIHLARWWNPAVEDQCTGRALRIGQTRPVSMHLPLAVIPGNDASFDMNLHRLLARKRQLMRDALAPPAESDADRDQLLEETMAGFDAAA